MTPAQGALLLGLLRLAAGLDNGLARTPPMGWSSWNAFHDQIDEALVRETADALVSTGLAEAGYVYVNLDGTSTAVQHRQSHKICSLSSTQ